MKYLISFLIFASLLFYCCGNDSTTNNNNSGGETILFSLDSLSITLNTNFGIIDSNFVINNAPNIKITFDCSTNADSMNSYAIYRISAADTSIIYKDTLFENISLMNNSHIVNVNGSNNFILKFYTQINGNAPYYLRLRNVKVIKI